MNSSYSALFERLGHRFNDELLVERALTHRSFSGANNERLEFLGDSIVNMVVAEALYQAFPRADEGDLSRMRAQLVRGETLAELAQELGVGEHLRLGSGEMKSGGARRASTLADAMEALVGAIFCDSGLPAARQCLLTWYAKRLDDVSPDTSRKDAKTALQEYLQGRGRGLPAYHLVATQGAEHEKLFVVRCEVQGCAPETAEGSSRRQAEQLAAQKILESLRGRQS